MATYIVESPHTPEQCVSTLDSLVAMGPAGLPRWDFGCAVGDHSNHVAYAVIDAEDGAAAREAVPTAIRARARLTEVGKFTAEQVRSFHQS